MHLQFTDDDYDAGNVSDNGDGGDGGGSMAFIGVISGIGVVSVIIGGGTCLLVIILIMRTWTKTNGKRNISALSLPCTLPLLILS